MSYRPKRLELLRQKLAENGADAFISFSQPDNQYLTGFLDTAGFYETTSAIVVTPTESAFLCDGRYTEQAQQQVEGFAVEEIKGPLTGGVARMLTAMNVRVAVFDPLCMTVAELYAVQKGFGGELRSTPNLVFELRLVKSPDEVEHIQAASAITDAVLATVLDDVEPGLTERQLAARIEYEFRRKGADGAAFDVIALFGPRTSLVHGHPDDTPLRSGDIILVDMGCRKNGYCSDLTRTCVFDTIPNTWFEEAYELTLTAQRAGLAAVQPGALCRDVDAAARRIIAEAGYGKYFGHGLGHGVGIEIHEGPRLNSESENALETGMVITIEPGIYVPGKGGVRIEDLVVVTDDGCRILSSASKELKVLQV